MFCTAGKRTERHLKPWPAPSSPGRQVSGAKTYGPTLENVHPLRDPIPTRRPLPPTPAPRPQQTILDHGPRPCITPAPQTPRTQRAPQPLRALRETLRTQRQRVTPTPRPQGRPARERPAAMRGLPHRCGPSSTPNPQKAVSPLPLTRRKTARHHKGVTGCRVPISLKRSASRPPRRAITPD